MNLLDQVRRAVRVRHYSIRTEKTYVDWIRRFILFHKKRHPKDMAAKEINEYLSYLATDRNVAASTQGQALSAIVFLYRHVLGRDVGDLGDIVRAKRPVRIPVVLSADEVERILAQVTGTKALMLQLLYGTGMRIIELVRLRVKDIDFDGNSITIRRGKGAKDRQAILPPSLIPELHEHLIKAKALHEKDLAEGFGTVFLPHALDKKYPNANKEWGWQYVFPSSRFSVDPRSGRRQRHHVFESVLQKTIKRATVLAGINKTVHAHTFRHSFATELLLNGQDIRTVQELLGHKNVNTTQIYTHVLKTGPLGVHSPLERIKRLPPVASRAPKLQRRRLAQEGPPPVALAQEGPPPQLDHATPPPERKEKVGVIIYDVAGEKTAARKRRQQRLRKIKTAVLIAISTVLNILHRTDTHM